MHIGLKNMQGGIVCSKIDLKFGILSLAFETTKFCSFCIIGPGIDQTIIRF
jgi:hypothetical protein